MSFAADAKTIARGFEILDSYQVGKCNYFILGGGGMKFCYAGLFSFVLFNFLC